MIAGSADCTSCDHWGGIFLAQCLSHQVMQSSCIQSATSNGRKGAPIVLDLLSFFHLLYFPLPKDKSASEVEVGS